MDILVSIIIPVYQIKEYITKCLDACIKQTYANLEIVVVDDGSTDGGEKICDAYAAKDKRVKVIHQKNGGLVSARKTGIENAHGEYVMYVDGDDYIDMDYVEKMVMGITNNIDIVWDVNYIREYENGSIDAGLGARSNFDDDNIQKKLYEYTIGKNGFQNEINYVMVAKLFRTVFLRPIQKSISDNVTILEDIACVSRCLALTEKVIFKQIGGYHYLQRPDSMSGEKECSLAKLNPFFKDTIDYFDRNGIANAVILDQLKGWYGSSLLRWGYIDLFNNNSECLFPFTGLKKGSNIVIYGLGKVGTHFLEYFNQSQEFEVVACSDRRDIGTAFMGVQFVKCEHLYKCQFDYVVVASNITSFIRDMRANLTNNGIGTDKIITVDFDKIINLSIDDLLALKDYAEQN